MRTVGRWRQDALVPRRVSRIFADSERALAPSVPIRRTTCGVWVPTPLAIIDKALDQLAGLGLLTRSAPGVGRAEPDEESAFIDAGTGDGRVAALLARFDATTTVYAVERDAALLAQAHANLDRLAHARLLDRSHVQLLDADYTTGRSYAPTRLDVHRVRLIFNYPDGNQDQLARFVATETGPSTRLCLLTHNRELEIDTLRQDRHVSINVPGEPAWRLAIYRSPDTP